MTTEQLQRARRERWRQNGNPLLTLDDAERWLAENPLCLVLPRRAHLPIPAPSFVEAVTGRADATPAPAEVAQAQSLIARLVASGAAVPLNLFGAVGDRPDFLAAAEALPYLYALQADRKPGRPPSIHGAGRVSPLALEVWKALERDGILTTAELRERLGREVTEAAVLRAIGELWQTLRVIPIHPESAADKSDGEAHWERLHERHSRELNAGSTLSQATALSVLASFYLQSAVAATGEEIELFLSPLASRSRVRDVLRGLTATRQLGEISLRAETHYYVEGALPEFPEEEETKDVFAAQSGERPGAHAGLEGNEPDTEEIVGASRPARQERVGRPNLQAPPRKRPARKGGSEKAAEGRPRTFGRQAAKRESGGSTFRRWNSGEREAHVAPQQARQTDDRGDPMRDQGGQRPPFRRTRQGGERPAFGERQARFGGKPDRTSGEFRRTTGAPSTRRPPRLLKSDQAEPGQRRPPRREQERPWRGAARGGRPENSNEAGRGSAAPFRAARGGRESANRQQRPPSRDRQGGRPYRPQEGKRQFRPAGPAREAGGARPFPPGEQEGRADERPRRSYRPTRDSAYSERQSAGRGVDSSVRRERRTNSDFRNGAGEGRPRKEGRFTRPDRGGPAGERGARPFRQSLQGKRGGRSEGRSGKREDRPKTAGEPNRAFRRRRPDEGERK